MMRRVWIIDPNQNEEPKKGFFACNFTRKGKGTEEAFFLHKKSNLYYIFRNGKMVFQSSNWLNAYDLFPHGLIGRVISKEEYEVLLKNRISELQNGGIFAADPLTHPAPVF